MRARAANKRPVPTSVTLSVICEEIKPAPASNEIRRRTLIAMTLSEHSRRALLRAHPFIETNAGLKNKLPGDLQETR